ncbi:MAG: NAD+ synthase [Bacteroidetes bacterium CG18_big_fil_WC_8_21_14_2_50_41_14]|nr:MAG: NAD+ synthase [Bacteroidetes bacterium CG18_big_fil_WC_8_21_14_2_50_41_14]PJB56789.1 MAG: NAD+ synthase [Bacteroidetes bacterium CG_4_9_14_3_um_filter_41_19]
MKIALAQLNYHIGNFDSNVNKILHSIRRAKDQGADIVVFAELAISGYPPRDFLDFTDFVDQCQVALEKIAPVCNGIGVIVGLPTYNHAPKGKPLFNSAAFLAKGRLQQLVHKTLLPNYDIFDEYRYFEPNRNFEVLKYQGKRIALTICEDLWNVHDNPLYIANPMEELKCQLPEMIINIAASPFNYAQARERKEVLQKNSVRYKVPLVYVNHVGAQTELLFDGGSLVMDGHGNLVHELLYFEEDFRVVDMDHLDARSPMLQPDQVDEIALIHDALVMGIRNYFGKLGFQQAIVGLSGGIDSAVTSVLAAEALGADNVYNVLLPSRYSTGHSVDDAKELVLNVGMPYDTIPIENGFIAIEETLAPFFKNLPSDVTEENIQARVRGVILMALSNKFGYILLNTSNKSEAAVGYGTLYGDMNGGLSVIGDVYKTKVFQLARYINRNKEVIPENIITKPPSAELRHDQKDSDSLPEYEVLDEILYQYIEERRGPKEIIAMGFDQELVRWILKLVNTNEYKRYQTPPILRVTGKAFGMGRRMPIVARYLS